MIKPKARNRGGLWVVMHPHATWINGIDKDFETAYEQYKYKYSSYYNRFVVKMDQDVSAPCVTHKPTFFQKLRSIVRL